MGEINKFGEFEIAPKKGYVSLRRKRQFAMLGPKTTHALRGWHQRQGLEQKCPPAGAAQGKHVQLHRPGNRCEGSKIVGWIAWLKSTF